MSHHNVASEELMETEKEEESDDDFLPAIPEALLQPNEDAAIAATTADCHIAAERRKRQRSFARSDGTDDTLSENLCSSKERHYHHHNKKNDGENIMGLLNAEGFPSPLLFERSYRHVSSVHDVGVVRDDIGALIVTIDAGGTLRAWRKLPRGAFFMGERQGLFPQSAPAGGNAEASGTAKHFILAGILTSSFFVVRVTPSVETAAGVVEVSVEVRQVNPVLMTVESRFSFYFSAALRCEGAALAHWKESVTQRPFLLHHDYQPYLAFFTAEKGELSNVVLAPCVAERKGGGASRCDGSAAVFLPPVSLSTSGLVVCCRQHSSSGLVVLVDEKGIIDYARIVARPRRDGGATVVLLQVVSGVPGRGAADTLMLRKWLTFDRRQKTGFFSLLREGVTAAKSGQRMMPLCVSFSPTGEYFLVASVVLSEKTLRVCFHLFRFSSGAFLCRGETEETLAPSLCGADALQMTLWVMRGAVYDVVVDDAVGTSLRGGAGGVWVFLPELVCGMSYGGHVCGRRIFVFRVASSLAVAPFSKTPTAENGHSQCVTTSIETPFYVEQLLTPIGNLEKSISEAALRMSTPPFSNAVVGDQHFAVPLVLLRLVVPASQALKNVVAQSPVGSALSQEDVKRLFVSPNNTGASGAATDSEQLFGSSDPTFCTTSLGGAALLFYTNHEAQLGENDLLALKDVGVFGTAAKNSDANSLRANQVCCEKTLSELHRNRDFDCSDLLQLQLSVRRAVPRELMAIEEKENGDFARGPETAVTAQMLMDGNNLDHFEEQRVQKIITAAVRTPVQCDTRVVRASLFVENFGVITVRFLPQFAPKAVENFLGLAREGFYDGLTFHRVVPGFMAQGGCPLGDGTGGKSIFGGTFEDEGMDVMDFFLYPSVYWLCMANRGPNTNESQFFITVGETASWLNGKHTVFGFVVGGKDIVQAIVQTERGSEDRPVTPVVIRRVVVVEPDQE